LIELYPTLATERLILREPTPDDAVAVFAIFSDTKVTQYHDSPTYSELVQAVGWLERRASAFANRRAIRWMIVCKEDNVVIGSCGFGSCDNTNHTAEIGYELASAYWKRGVMTEALTAILEFGFHTMELRRVIAQVMLDNTASIQLLIRLGFENEGVLKQHGFWKGEHHDLYQFALERVLC
jgi:ribosomal-protein-alanine N-acetyltransferase